MRWARLFRQKFVSSDQRTTGYLGEARAASARPAATTATPRQKVRAQRHQAHRPGHAAASLAGRMAGSIDPEETARLTSEDSICDKVAQSRDRKGVRRSAAKGTGGAGQGRDVQVSRALSRLLRHQAENAGIKLDGEGFAPLDKVVSVRTPFFAVERPSLLVRWRELPRSSREDPCEQGTGSKARVPRRPRLTRLRKSSRGALCGR